jgi:hypothetical protein
MQLLPIFLLGLTSLASASRYIALTDTHTRAEKADGYCRDEKLRKGTVKSRDLGLIAEMMEDNQIHSTWFHSIDNRTYEHHDLAIELVDKQVAKKWYKTHPVNHLTYNKHHCTDNGYCAVVKKVRVGRNSPKRVPLCVISRHDSRNDEIDRVDRDRRREKSRRHRRSRYGKSRHH